MACMKHRYESYAEANKELVRIRQDARGKGHNRLKGRRRRPAYEHHIYECPLCAREGGKTVYHLASRRGELWKK